MDLRSSRSRTWGDYHARRMARIDGTLTFALRVAQLAFYGLCLCYWLFYNTQY